jgi:hypothetical protein
MLQTILKPQNVEQDLLVALHMQAWRKPREMAAPCIPKQPFQLPSPDQEGS